MLIKILHTNESNCLISATIQQSRGWTVDGCGQFRTIPSEQTYKYRWGWPKMKDAQILVQSWFLANIKAGLSQGAQQTIFLWKISCVSSPRGTCWKNQCREIVIEKENVAKRQAGFKLSISWKRVKHSTTVILLPSCHTFNSSFLK